MLQKYVRLGALALALILPALAARAASDVVVAVPTQGGGTLPLTLSCQTASPPANCVLETTIGGPATDPCQSNAHTFTPISVASAANTKVVAGASAKKTYVCHVFLFAAPADNVAIVEGSGTNCATSTLGVIGGATAATGVNLSANQGFVEGNGSNAVAATTVAANDLCLITSASSQLSGVIVTVQQ